MQVFDTFTDVINQEKIDRWIAPAITPIAVTKNMEKGKRVSISGTVDKVSLCHLNWNYMYYQYFSSSKTKRQVEFF